ncbi:MAG: hypothetical protein AAGC96_02775 [Pseudomonadota bacterium]
MGIEVKSYDDQLSGIQSLASVGKTNAQLVEGFVNRELAKVLKQRKLKKIQVKSAIFSHLEKGLVVSGPVFPAGKATKQDLTDKTGPVGFLVNTLRLVDPVSRRALEPGVSLIEMRPLRGGDFAFDYVDGDGHLKMATDTQRPHRPVGGSDLGTAGDGQPAGKQHFDIEVNHVIVLPSLDGLPLVCTSYHDGTEKCHLAVGPDEEPGFTILN